MSKVLSLSKIRMDGGTQPRSTLNSETVTEYAELMNTGVKFPPVTVFYDGAAYWLADGFHRVKAAWQSNLSGIDSEIIQGTLEEAKWFSFGVNKSHGLRRTNEDKQRAVRAALEHSKAQGMSNAEIARHVGVVESTVRSWRDQLIPSSRITKMTERTVTRAGTTYQQNVTNIGRRSSLSQKETESTPRQIDEEPQRSVSECPPVPKSIQVRPIDRKAVWSAQIKKNFVRELIRLVRSYEKSNPQIEALLISHSNGQAADVEIVCVKQEATA